MFALLLEDNMVETKKFYWLRLKDDFFNNKEVKKLRRIAGGDTFIIIYLKMQLLSISEGGIIKFEGTEVDLSEQLSLELDEELDNVKIVLAFMEANNLIEGLTDNDYLLTRVPPLIGSETDAAERMRKMRNNVTPVLQTVTQSKRKEIEKREKRKEIEEEVEEEVTETMKQALRLADLLLELHRKVDDKYKGNLELWAKDIEYLIRIDEREVDDIEKVINWCKQEDNFWFLNIMSGKKLRQHFPKLLLQMNEKPRKKNKVVGNESYDLDIGGYETI